MDKTELVTKLRSMVGAFSRLHDDYPSVNLEMKQEYDDRGAFVAAAFNQDADAATETFASFANQAGRLLVDAGVMEVQPGWWAGAAFLA